MGDETKDRESFEELKRQIQSARASQARRNAPSDAKRPTGSRERFSVIQGKADADRRVTGTVPALETPGEGVRKETAGESGRKRSISIREMPGEGEQRGSTPGDGAQRGSTPGDGAQRGSTPGDGAQRGSSPGEGTQKGIAVETVRRRTVHAQDTRETAKTPEGSRKDRQERPARMEQRPPVRTLVSTQALYVILAILCVVLVVSLVWQEYYLGHTYEKGELAKMSSAEVQQRRKFMTESTEENGVIAASVGNAAGQGAGTSDGSGSGQVGGENASGENGSGQVGGGNASDESGSGQVGGENASGESGSGQVGGENASGEGGSGQVSGENVLDGSAAGQEGAPRASSGEMIVVETSDAVNLKNQLRGVLPGITAPGQTSADLIAEANLLAEQYDYDAASALLKSCSTYGTDSDMQEAVAGYQTLKESCVAYPVDQVTHIFFHTLIKDAAKAFDGDEYEGGYNQYMVTIHEFNSIIEQMYRKGYVMVTLEDMAPAVAQADGTVTFTEGSILLPKGKIPFVLSQDDVSYYHYMDGDGFASRLIVDENGDIKNEYIEDDGSVSVGDYDMIPLIDRFLETHPDFSYRGAKGYIALTGYDGILGYRTDICYKTRENLDTYQEQFFAEHPDFGEDDYERECREAVKVADALKEDGWRFASHTWGHVGLGEGATTLDQFKTDTDKWDERVKPLIGDTDVLIYAFGGDIGGVEDYSGQRFDYLKSKGFNYFCGVDSAVHWVQLRSNYVRQGRRNIDGYRMYYNPDMLSDLFDVSEAWDPLRPSTVPPI